MTDPTPDVPGDDKDWTWVLEEPCPDCGFDAADIALSMLGERLRASADAWVRVLERSDVAERPAPIVWSALEYACHVRDVYVLFRERIELMLATDNPTFANWDQDATARESRYSEADPNEVAPALRAAAEALAATFDGVADDQWHRPGTRSNGSAFTVASLGVYCLHDPVHHLHDVGEPLA